MANEKINYIVSKIILQTLTWEDLTSYSRRSDDIWDVFRTENTRKTLKTFGWEVDQYQASHINDLITYTDINSSDCRYQIRSIANTNTYAFSETKPST